VRPGEESVRAETGKQTVWPVAVSSGLVDMCAHHKTIHEGHSNLANQIAAQTGLAQEEHEELSAHTGTCVECKRRAGKGELARSLETLMPPGHMRERNERDPGYQTPRMGPRGPQARPRKPDWTPGGTKPFAPLRQSENALGDTTDWDAHYDALPDTVHRGYSMGVPNKLYDAIHDPQADQAHVAKEIIARTGRRATGTHWSADLGTARGFATGSLPTGGSHIALVLHGQRPDREDIETRPAMLKRMEIFDHARGSARGARGPGAQGPDGPGDRCLLEAARGAPGRRRAGLGPPRLQHADAAQGLRGDAPAAGEALPRHHGAGRGAAARPEDAEMSSASSTAMVSAAGGTTRSR
jgi:hypothetical protein